LTAREKQSRALLLSSFFWTLGEADRGRLRRTMRELLDHDDTLADRLLILRAVDDTWPATARPPDRPPHRGSPTSTLSAPT
jgi:hypothetical protein